MTRKEYTKIKVARLVALEAKHPGELTDKEKIEIVKLKEKYG